MTKVAVAVYAGLWQVGAGSRIMKLLIVEDQEMIVSYLGGETHVARALAAGGSAYVMKMTCRGR